MVSANGSRFVFSPAVPPQILDVRCTAPSSTTPTKSLTFRWSHITGEVSLDGKAAFTLHPSTGTISGTPELDLSSDTLGRGSLDVTCKVALGGAGSAAVAAVWTVDIYIYIRWLPFLASTTWDGG